MPIVVNHGDPTLQAQMAVQAGQGQHNKEQERFQLQRDATLRDFQERQRQFNVNTQMAQEQMAMRDLEGRRANEARQIEAAQQSAALEQQFANQQLNREYDLLGRQAGFQQQMAVQQNQWAAQSAQFLDEQIGEQMKGLRKMELDPEGQRIFNELAGKHSVVKGQRGQLMPQQYAQLQQALMDDLQAAGLEQYEIKEPTAEEMFRKSLTRVDGMPVAAPGQPLFPGTYMQSGMRNGVPTFEKFTVPDPNLTPQQQYDARVIKTGVGSEIYFDDEGKPHEFKAGAGKTGPTQWEQDMGNLEMDLKKQDQEDDRFDKTMELALKLSTPQLQETPGPVDKDGKPTTKVDLVKPDIKKIGSLATEITEARHKALGRRGLPGQSQTAYGHSAEGGMNPNEFQPVMNDPEHPGNPQRQPGQQQAPQQPQQPETSPMRGIGTQDDPLDIRGVDPDEVARRVQIAPSGTYFLDENGNLFMKP